MIIFSKPKIKHLQKRKRDTKKTMSAQKIQFASLLLAFFLLFSQSTGKCNYRYPVPPVVICKKNNDCKNACVPPSEDPNHLECITSRSPPKYFGTCCCLLKQK
ncbi:hypothetical protein Bca4012_026050 [Brassica carinata]